MKRLLFISFMLLGTAAYCITVKSSWAYQTLSHMTLDQKIGQVLMAAVPTNPSNPDNPTQLAQRNLPTHLNKNYIEEMILKYHIGGVLYVCEGTIAENVTATNHFQRLSPIPLLVAGDFEPGLIRLVDAIKYPRNMTSGAVLDLEGIEQLGELLGLQAKCMGIHVVFGPVADVNNNPDNPVINDRSFGEGLKEVSKRAVAFMKGLQKAGVVACGKHFPGHGDTDTDSHLALPRIPHDRARFEKFELVPFKALIRNNIGSIMVAHLMVPALDEELPSSLSTYIIDLLHILGHKGLVFSDGMIMKALTEHFKNGDAELKALQAGVHMLVFPADVPQAFNRIKEAIKKGEWSEQKLDVAVLKILEQKEKLGLHRKENLFVAQDNVKAAVNSTRAYEIKRQIYREAMTLVANDSSIPLKDIRDVAMIQIGGEKDSVWQHSFAQKNVPTFYVAACPTDEELAKMVSSLSSYKKVVVSVFDMSKFANQDFGIDIKIRTFITQLQEKTKTILTLFGSPYALKFFEQVGTILEAYEPDPDVQQAATDILFGDLTAKGSLPVTACGRFKAGHSIA